MSDQERIEALELKLEQLQQLVVSMIDGIQSQLGAASLYHGAIGALIESHHAYAELSPLLNQMVAEFYAIANAESGSEAYLEGMQVGQSRLAESLRNLEIQQPTPET